ncbi:MAG: 3'-5' exoribonuclease YhaM family protein [Vicinamibacterales bacterium]
MQQLPRIRDLTPESAGTGFYLCVQKDTRSGRSGPYLVVGLQDRTGRIGAKIFDDVERLRNEFDAGEFVKVKARADRYGGQLQLVIENIRRVNPAQDRQAGFSEADCVLSSSRSIDEMWKELAALVDSVGDRFIRRLLQDVLARYGEKLRVWPAAQLVHHAWRGGFLEHVLKIAELSLGMAAAYGARRDLLVAGAIVHDLGKLQELDYDVSATYSREGRLVGHLTLGVIMLREIALAIPDFPPVLLTELEHLIVSHHGSHDLGSPVEPMTLEAFLLSAADDIDAKVNQIQQAIDDPGGEGEFTAYQHRFGRVFWKGARGADDPGQG